MIRKPSYFLHPTSYFLLPLTQKEDCLLLHTDGYLTSTIPLELLPVRLYNFKDQER